MAHISVKVYVEKQHYLGKATGKLKATINQRAFYANSKEELVDEIEKWMYLAAASPQIAVLSSNPVNDENLRIVVGHAGECQTWRPTENTTGFIPVTTGTFSSRPVYDEAKSALMHLAQNQWTYGNNEPPAFLLESMKSDYRNWAEQVSKIYEERNGITK